LTTQKYFYTSVFFLVPNYQTCMCKLGIRFNRRGIWTPDILHARHKRKI